MTTMVGRQLSRIMIPAAFVATLGACSNLLEVEFPGRIPSEQINSPTLAPVLMMLCRPIRAPGLTTARARMAAPSATVASRATRQLG